MRPSIAERTGEGLCSGIVRALEIQPVGESLGPYEQVVIRVLQGSFAVIDRIPHVSRPVAGAAPAGSIRSRPVGSRLSRTVGIEGRIRVIRSPEPSIQATRDNLAERKTSAAGKQSFKAHTSPTADRQPAMQGSDDSIAAIHITVD